MVIFGWTNLLSELIPAVPLALVWLAGMVYAGLTWRRHPRVSLLTGIGLVILGLATLAATGVSYLPLLIHSRTGQDFGSMGGILLVANLGLSLIKAVGLGLLLAAVFLGRMKPEGMPEGRLGA